MINETLKKEMSLLSREQMESLILYLLSTYTLFAIFMENMNFSLNSVLDSMNTINEDNKFSEAFLNKLVEGEKKKVILQ